MTPNNGDWWPGRSFYSEHLHEDAEKIEAAMKKTLARLRNAGDVLLRHAEWMRDADELDKAVAHALKKGKLGKQTRRRLKQAHDNYQGSR